MTMSIGEHTAKAFDLDLQRLTSQIAEMGGRTEKLLADSIDALMVHDCRLARAAIASDDAIDTMHRRIEEFAVEIIARRQPMAVDLRYVIGILRISNELERVGDLAKNIGKRVMSLDGPSMPRQTLRGVAHMGQLAIRQLRDVLDAVSYSDVGIAAAVWNRDEEIDALYTSLFRELLTYMMEDPELITFGIHALFCAKNIERIGDHTTNIAETLCYMVEGQTFPDERPKADTTSTIGARPLAL